MQTIETNNHRFGTFVSAKAFLFRPSGEMLVLRRSATDSDHPGTYDLPGGGVEPGEELEGAVLREVRQETGFKLGRTALGLVYTTTGLHPRYRDNAVRLFYIGFVDDPKAEPTLSDEHDSAQWVSVARAHELLTHPPHAEALSYLADVGVLNTLDTVALEYAEAS